MSKRKTTLMRYSLYGPHGCVESLIVSIKSIRYLALPLTTNLKIEGGLRIIVKGDVIEVHYGVHTVDARPCGEKTLGIDKGYTEALVDSDGVNYGSGLGEILTAESDSRKKRSQSRGKLGAIANRSRDSKRAKIKINNLGRLKLLKRKDRHRKIVSTLIHNSVHSLVAKAKTVVSEDLSKYFKSKDRGKNANRRLSEWTKGVIAKALNNVASRRGASVKLVNAAYTSQICPDCDCFGKRDHDKFHCAVCKDVKRSDHVSARNTLARLTDPEIKLYTPYREVKAILLRRSLPRLRLSNQDSSCVEAACAVTASTESEIPY